MQTSIKLNEQKMLSEIEELRAEFQRTQDLYREVCVLLFFRYGITPTANKLYQLVRKGSMSAPTEALHQFWTTLRERSSVTVEHADLPDELRAAAGEMVAALWKSAQTMSRGALAAFHAQAAATVDAAQASEARMQGVHATVLRELEHAHAQLHANEELARQLRGELAAAAAAKAGLDGQLEEVRRQVGDLQSQLFGAREEQAAEREKLAERTQLAEQRFADMEKRALLEIDRERTASAKLQKTLESERRAHASASERLRADHNVAQGTIGVLREQIGSLQTAVDTLTKERDRGQVELQSAQGELADAIRRSAVDSACADQLRQELKGLRSTASGAKLKSHRTVKSERDNKRQSKLVSNGNEE